MSAGMQRLLTRLAELEQSPASHPTRDLRAQIIVTHIYLIITLSIPLAQLSELLLFALYPIISAADQRVRFGSIARQSLVVVPFAALLGLFNALYNRETIFTIGSIAVTRGVIEFASIVVRALLSVQALLILVRAEGYNHLCHSLRRLGVPAMFVTQLLMLYRYLFVLIEQLLSLTRARAARSFGGRAMPINEWGAIVGQLTVRSIERTERISRAMQARGFEGRMPDPLTAPQRWTWRSTLYLLAWSAVLIAARLLHPVEQLAKLFNTL